MSLQSQRLPSEAVPGPMEGTRITEAYARMVARDAYFWAWPMVNMFNKRSAFSHAPEPGLLGGIMPFAPLNRLSMLSDYVEPTERNVACPNQDVVYGAGLLALDVSPVVVQVPDFANRFWVYQAVDLRTDSFADLGAMYGTEPGFYLLVGPQWTGPVPAGITKAFRAKTSTGFIGPRVFQDDTPQDKAAVQSVLQGIDVYPLAMFDGTPKRRDWRQAPSSPTRRARVERPKRSGSYPTPSSTSCPRCYRTRLRCRARRRAMGSCWPWWTPHSRIRS
jgi:hypothetical protein